MKIKDARLGRVRHCSQNTILHHNLDNVQGSLLKYMNLQSKTSIAKYKTKKSYSRKAEEKVSATAGARTGRALHLLRPRCILRGRG